MRRSTLPPSTFTTKRLIRRYEGGAIYAAEQEGKHYVIVNEAALVDMLSAEDREHEGCPVPPNRERSFPTDSGTLFSVSGFTGCATRCQPHVW